MNQDGKKFELPPQKMNVPNLANLGNVVKRTDREATDCLVLVQAEEKLRNEAWADVTWGVNEYGCLILTRENRPVALYSPPTWLAVWNVDADGNMLTSDDPERRKCIVTMQTPDGRITEEWVGFGWGLNQFGCLIINRDKQPAAMYSPAAWLAAESDEKPEPLTD